MSMKKTSNNTNNIKRKKQYTKEEKRQALKNIKGCFANITIEEYEENKNVKDISYEDMVKKQNEYDKKKKNEPLTLDIINQYIKEVRNKKYILFDEIELIISESDFEFLCRKRFFTNKPTIEDIQSEFVTGTGITPNKKHLWKEANERFHEYVNDLREIDETGVNKMARERVE